jgi:hypothetical protein
MPTELSVQLARGRVWRAMIDKVLQWEVVGEMFENGTGERKGQECGGRVCVAWGVGEAGALMGGWREALMENAGCLGR